ncbi:MAG: hypothetical protein NTV04_19995 [Deltaproteobacteria bacterium]|nr:hypothetical protein [Deltaproteobacteria bacterium]
MNPTVEVLSPEGTQLQIVPMPALPAPPAKEKKPVLQEKEIHRQMLAYYFALGKDRSLSKVAEHFGKTQAMIEKYSHIFNFKKRIAELENRSKSDLFRDKTGDLLLLLLDSLTKPGKETGTIELTSSAKTTAETIRLCVSSFKELRTDQREGEPGEDSGRGGGNGKGPKGGIMVNVIFKG